MGRRRRCRCKVSSRAAQLDEGVVEHDGFRVAKQLGVESVEHGVVLQPHACKPVDAGLEGAVGIPKGLDFVKTIEWVIYANATDQLIEIQEGKGRRRFLDGSAAHLGTPGKIATQLPIAHGVIGGKVRLERTVVGAVVLKVGHQQALAVEKLGFRKPATRAAFGVILPARYLAHLAVLVGEEVLHLTTSFENRLVSIDFV